MPKLIPISIESIKDFSDVSGIEKESGLPKVKTIHFIAEVELLGTGDFSKFVKGSHLDMQSVLEAITKGEILIAI